MKILFIAPLSYSVYPFQIASLSAFLKSKGHQASYLELILKDNLDKKGKRQILNRMKKFQPDLIGISSYQLTFEWVKQICRYLKSKSKVPIIVGGYHATLAPEEVISFPAIDIICRGEGEYPLLELMDSLKVNKVKTNIKNLWFKKGKKIIKNGIRPLIENLNSLPLMDREMMDYQKHLNQGGKKRYLAVMGSRGCPFNCSNCSNHALRQIYPNQAKYVRLRSTSNIIREIKKAMKKYDFEGVSFEDDTFTLYPDWVEKFCDQYQREIGLDFFCNARPETSSLKLMRLLKKAGCEHISIGIESGDEKIRKTILRRIMTNTQIKKAFQDARKAGLKVRSFNMVGLPYETRLSLLKTIWLNFQVAPYQIQTTIYYPFKGTDLGDLCYQKGWVNKKREKQIKVLSNDTILDHPNLSRQEIKAAKWLNSAMALRSGNFSLVKAGLKMALGKE
jgi:radical SAM superfamily enzyme YgiQ (UPF0313 family)